MSIVNLGHHICWLLLKFTVLTNGACCHSLAQAADHPAGHQHILHMAAAPACSHCMKLSVQLPASSKREKITWLSLKYHGKLQADPIHDMF